MARASSVALAADGMAAAAEASVAEGFGVIRGRTAVVGRTVSGFHVLIHLEKGHSKDQPRRQLPKQLACQILRRCWRSTSSVWLFPTMRPARAAALSCS